MAHVPGTDGFAPTPTAEDVSSTVAPSVPGVQMPVTVLAPNGTAPTVNTANAASEGSSGHEINFVTDNRENGILSENSEYYTTNSSGGLVYVDKSANTTTILNPKTGEASVYNADTEMVTVYTDDPSTSGYSLHVDSTYGVNFTPEGKIVNGNGEGFEVNSGTMQNFYSTNGLDLDAVSESYSNSNPYSNVDPSSLLRGPNASATAGTSVYVINSDGVITDEVGESPSDFAKYFEMADVFGASYVLDNCSTYAEFYDAVENYDVFGILDDRFSSSIDAMTSETGTIGTAWADFEQDFDTILNEFDDLFSVGGLNISAALSPLKESYSAAKTEVDAFLTSVAEEYSSVSARKAEILRQRALQEAAENGNTSAANDAMWLRNS